MEATRENVQAKAEAMRAELANNESWDYEPENEFFDALCEYAHFDHEEIAGYLTMIKAGPEDIADFGEQLFREVDTDDTPQWLRDRITTEEQAVKFVSWAVENGLQFHPDDYCLDCLRHSDVNRATQLLVGSRMREAQQVLPCIYGALKRAEDAHAGSWKCTWSPEFYGDTKPRNVKLDFFTDDNGFDEETRDAVADLQIGEVHEIHCLGGLHVTAERLN